MGRGRPLLRSKNDDNMMIELLLILIVSPPPGVVLPKIKIVSYYFC